ncbi:GAF domain-containing protein [Bacillus sp. BGMRC 2118]|nr:GAF domain-containing protein [Bacillus sp. BGMRC 2118]
MGGVFLDPLSLEKLYEGVTKGLKEVTWFPESLAILVILFILVVGTIVTFKVARGGQELSLFGGAINLKPNLDVLKLKEQFETLNEYDRLKSNVLKLLNQTYLTLPSLECYKSNVVKLERNLNLFYDFFLPGIISTITKERDNQHRIAIFIKDSSTLKILRGNGYSLEGLKRLSLNVHNSKAGHAFINNIAYFNNNLTADPSYVRNPKATKEYKSLLCVPIVYNEDVIGILNIDGLKENSFDKDDADYITYFANALAPILKLQLEHTEITIFEEEELHVR